VKRGTLIVKRAVVVMLLAVVAAGGCRKKPQNDANVNAANKVAMRLVKLYFETPQMLLTSEPRNIALPESPAAAMPVVVRELMKGPAAVAGRPAATLRLFPADTVVRGTYLLPGGTVVVDLGGTTLTQGWGTGSHQELMAVQSLVQTLAANFADARRVRILVNGTPAETLAGHVSLSRSLVPLPNLVDPQAR
jgi:spore germination protein GerM